jgi:hypothetical protein
MAGNLRFHQSIIEKFITPCKSNHQSKYLRDMTHDQSKLIQMNFLVLTFLAIVTLTIAFPSNCGGNANGNGGVLEANDLDVHDGEECSKKSICTYTCPNNGQKLRVNTAGSPLDGKYGATCTDKKRGNVDRTIEGMIPLNTRNIRIGCTGGVRGNHALQSIEEDEETTLDEADSLMMAIQRQEDYNFGDCTTDDYANPAIMRSRTIAAIMIDFASTISRLCEDGSVTATTPRDVLQALWVDYVSKQVTSTTAKSTVQSMTALAKRMLDATVNLWTAPCDCTALATGLGAADMATVMAAQQRLCNMGQGAPMGQVGGNAPQFDKPQPPKPVVNVVPPKQNAPNHKIPGAFKFDAPTRNTRLTNQIHQDAPRHAPTHERRQAPVFVAPKHEAPRPPVFKPAREERHEGAPKHRR